MEEPMAYKVLYRKYRPQDFNDLYGQDNIKTLLKESIKQQKLAHAYLFSGPRGTGKTSTAKLFAKTINCENSIDGIPCNKCNSCLNYEESPDIIEIDAASNNGVDEIRDLRDNAKILPALSKYKVYIIDEVHMLSQSAWNAFLKILEEPPKHIIFILATTEIQKIPITILSRCQRYNFQKINNNVISENLKRIADLEKIEIDEEAVKYLAELSDGGMRDALSFLDQLSKENQKITIELIEKTFGVIGTNDINEIIDALSSQDIDKFNQIIDNYKNKGLDLNLLINKLIDYLYSLEIKTINSGQNVLTITDIKNLSKDLSECYNKKGAFNLIKIILLSYFSNKNIDKQSKIISREIISEAKQENLEPIKTENHSEIIKIESSSETKEDLKENDFDEQTDLTKPLKEEFIRIRINNAYVGATKEIKSNFKNKWESFIKYITINNKSEILSLIEDLQVEVVSPTNVIFSSKSLSTSLLFNNNLELIEKEYQKHTNSMEVFICLDENRWLKEKSEFIKNKNKKYEYIEEIKTETEQTEVYNAAKKIFADEIIEVN
jgi:DNA polymerase III subunit gamma/tau